MIGKKFTFKFSTYIFEYCPLLPNNYAFCNLIRALRLESDPAPCDKKSCSEHWTLFLACSRGSGHETKSKTPKAVCDMGMRLISRRPRQITMVTHYTYTTLQIAWGVRCSLIPRPPLFLPFICVMETSEKRGRPGSVHHMSGHELDVVLCHGPALWSPPTGSDGDSPTHALLQLTSPSSPSRRHLSAPSVSSPVSVSSPRCRPGRSCRGYDIPLWIAYQEVMYP